jgi:hypothetical protein
MVYFRNERAISWYIQSKSHDKDNSCLPAKSTVTFS